MITCSPHQTEVRQSTIPPTPRPRSNLGSRRFLASPHETGVRQPTTIMTRKRFIQAQCCFLTTLIVLLLSAVMFLVVIVSIFGNSSFGGYATVVDAAVTAALVLILPLLATVLTAVCVEMTIDYNGNKARAHTSVELGLGGTPRPPTASTLPAVELEFSQPVTSTANNGNGHSTKDSRFDAISDFNSITITDNHLQVESRMTHSASAIPEERFDNIYADSETQEGPIPTVEDYANNQHLLITSHLRLRFKHQLCQRMSIAVTIMTAVGYAAIGLSLSTVKWTVVTAARHLDTTELLFGLSRMLLALACPILGLAGCTILGIALMYVSSGQIDGKQLISTLLPTVQLARKVSKSEQSRGKYYWMFASTTCIAINPPRGGRDRLRHYLDTTPATWMLMVVIYMSAIVAANYLVAFGVVVREDFIPTATDCKEHTWHCYKHTNSFQGKSVDCNVYVLANESSVLPLDDDLICYRFSSLIELAETIAESLAGSVAVYLISAYMTPYLIRGMLMLERVKKTKLWALIPTTLGGLGFLITIGMIVVYPASLLLLQACIFCLCLLAVGVLVGCSRTQLVLTAPEIQPSVIVDMDSKLITKIEMMLEEQALAES